MLETYLLNRAPTLVLDIEVKIMYSVLELDFCPFKLHFLKGLI